MAFAWYAAADLMVAYTDLGISAGMKRGISYAESLGLRIEERKVEGWI